MIVLRNLTKIYSLHGRHNVVADNINATFPSGVSVGLLGRNGAGKSTLLKMIAGTTHPTSGEILSDGEVSFPVGLASSLHPDLTGAQNTRFVARIYGVETEALMHFVEEFAELGEHFHLPVRSYSSGMRGRLSFGINMGIDFDTYLVDEITAVGDAAFKRKSRDVFLARMENAGAVFVSHSIGSIREMCTAGAFLDNGQLQYFDDVEEAIELYMATLEEKTVTMVEGSEQPHSDVRFPGDARMLFGLGAPQTRITWLGDCLRRHKPCHFPPAREPHYFDIRAGLGEATYQRRIKASRQLTDRMGSETGDARRNTARSLADLSALLKLHAAPHDGPERHDAYVDYVTDRRGTRPVVCDFTPDYCLLDRGSLSEMAMVGRARFVYVLRDPATRLWVQLWESLPPEARDLRSCTKRAKGLIDNPDLLERFPETDYSATMDRLDSAAPQDRIFYLFHEHLAGRDPINRICRALGLPDILEVSMMPLPAEDAPVMPDDIRAGLRDLLAGQYAEAARRFGDDLPSEWQVAHGPALQAVSDRPTDA